jgi:signal transduction histidine kinase
MLVAAKIQVGLAARRINDDRAARSLRPAVDLIDQCITESRALTVELSPPVLFDRGLVGGLEWLARWFQEKHDLPVELDLDPRAEPADEGTRIFLFQAARELLFNTVKHAQARSAEIRLERLEGDRLHLEVADDGRGFDPSQTKSNVSGGFGLFSIRERLELIGGRLDGIEATRRVMAELPGVSVIALSMHDNEDMAQAMREAGAVAYLTKGAPTDALVGVILAQSKA